MKISALALAATLGIALAPAGQAAVKSIVLVHGAFADGSCWSKVIPMLERDGYTVIAVQNPLTSLPDDVATTKRVIDAQKGSVVVVGHSYGGSVITDAAAGNSNVKALVYVAAFAPEEGESISATGAKFAAPPLNSALVPDAAGFLYIDREKFHDSFCQDVPAPEARIMAATQKPLNGSALEALTVNAAWKTVPCWYIVSSDDRAINPELERFYAKRMGATTTEIKSSHVSFLSHPKEIARIIEDAAKGSTTQATR